MKFSNIVEFTNLKSQCEFCGDSMSTKLVPQQEAEFKARVLMTFATISKELPRKFNYDQITFTSEESSELITFKYKFQDRFHDIFSVVKETNKIIGDVERVQKVIWDHKLCLSRCCINTACLETDNTYVAGTSNLVLERLNGRICDFHLDVEFLTAKPGRRSFALISQHDVKTKTLLISMNENKLGNHRFEDVVAQLPFMHLYKLSGSQKILNKIQTLVTFS